MTEQRDETAAEASHRGRGCLPVVLLTPLALVMVGALWSAHTYKRDPVVDLGRLPRWAGWDRWMLLLLVAVPCLLAVMVAVALNRGERRSVGACAVSLVFAVMVLVGGAIVYWEPQAYPTCKGAFPSGEVGTAPSQGPCTYEAEFAFDDYQRASRRDLAIVMGMAGLCAVIAVWLLTTPTAGDSDRGGEVVERPRGSHRWVQMVRGALYVVIVSGVVALISGVLVWRLSYPETRPGLGFVFPVLVISLGLLALGAVWMVICGVCWFIAAARQRGRRRPSSKTLPDTNPTSPYE